MRNEQTDSRRTRSGRRRRRRWPPNHFLIVLAFVLCGIDIGVGCQTPRAADPPPPCPVPSGAAVEEMDAAGDHLAVWLGRVLRYCEGIDVLRGD